MDPISVLAMKFVSKSFYLKTKYADGGEVVDIKTKAQHRRHADFMVRLEAYGMQAQELLTLTCQCCGTQKKIDPIGFDDKNFRRKLLHRWCIECYGRYYHKDRVFRVKGIKMFRCDVGGCVKPVEQKFSKGEGALLINRYKERCEECQDAHRAIFWELRADGMCKTCCEDDLKRLELRRDAECTNASCLLARLAQD